MVVPVRGNWFSVNLYFVVANIHHSFVAIHLMSSPLAFCNNVIVLFCEFDMLAEHGDDVWLKFVGVGGFRGGSILSGNGWDQGDWTAGSC